MKWDGNTNSNRQCISMRFLGLRLHLYYGDHENDQSWHHAPDMSLPMGCKGIQRVQTKLINAFKIIFFAWISDNFLFCDELQSNFNVLRIAPLL